MNYEANLKLGLTIAGFDPSSGAGVTADLKVFAAHGIYGMAAITALTVQSSQGVRRSEPVNAAILSETLACLSDDVRFAGVKIGMLATEDNVRAVARWLQPELHAPLHSPPQSMVVLDPVLIASSGTRLLDAGGTDAIRNCLLGETGWITPNWAELAALTGVEIHGQQDLPVAAARLQEMARALGNSSLNVIATGGDEADANHSSDFVLTAAGEQFRLSGIRVNTTSTHGTGCVFSTALLCELMAGRDALTACSNAKAFVTRALQGAVPIGRGRGPLV